MSKTIEIKEGEDRSDIRKVYGKHLASLAKDNEQIIVLDAETSNSTGADYFKTIFPERFVECYIAEQNMVGVATGLSINGYTPFISSFGAFLTRCFDQIRMASYGDVKLNFIGTHVGASIGMDGISQMALEDISMFGSINNSQIFYPADQIAYKKILKLMLENNRGINYCRVTRGAVKKVYTENTNFEVGGSNVVYKNHNLKSNLTIITGGFTIEEAIKSAKELSGKININVIDLYSIKPINKKRLLENIGDAKNILVVEDHYEHGGICSIIRELLQNDNKNIEKICVNKQPSSGSKDDLYEYLGLNSEHISKKIKNMYPKVSL